jgi:formylglycine-generating enzyme required for sulfatase activity
MKKVLLFLICISKIMCARSSLGVCVNWADGTPFKEATVEIKLSEDRPSKLFFTNEKGCTSIIIRGTFMADSIIVNGVKHFKSPKGQKFAPNNQYVFTMKESLVKLDGEQLFVKIPVNNKELYIGQCEVTQKLWAKYMKTNPSKTPGLSYPVHNISYKNVEQFLQKINDNSTDWHYRLPTIQEWQYASSPSEKPWFFGDERARLGVYAWYFGDMIPHLDVEKIPKNRLNDEEEFIVWECIPGAGNTLHHTKTKYPSFNGLYDIYGNVWEYVQKRDPKQKLVNLMGGSWSSHFKSTNTDGKLATIDHVKNPLAGLRLVAEPK